VTSTSPGNADGPLCRAHNKKTGERCRKPAMAGLAVCYLHGGATKRAMEKSERARALTAMQRFAVPVALDDPEVVNPLLALETEFRRTLGRIRWYDEQLARLSSENDLIWGKTEEKHVTATEYAGVDTTYAARSNILLDLQWKERQHLLAMEKLWVQARLDERRLSVMKSQVAALDKALVGILTGLGLDVHDPDVRQVVREALLALPTAVPFEEGASCV